MSANQRTTLLRALTTSPSRRSTLRLLIGSLLAGGFGWHAMPEVVAHNTLTTCKKRPGRQKRRCLKRGRKHATTHSTPGSQLTEPACTPSCAGKVCGPDGCTGSCGVCFGTCGAGSCTCSTSNSAAFTFYEKWWVYDPPDKWGSSPYGSFLSPNGIASAPDGTVYVADTGNHRIQFFRANGTFLGVWLGSQTKFHLPYGVAVAPDGTVYVADTYNHRIQYFSANGTFLGTWGNYGSDEGEFRGPSGVAVAPDRTVYVADTGNHRIQRFHAFGNLLTAWGSEGTNNGQFSSPAGVAVHPNCGIYVADTDNDRIQVFQPGASSFAL